MSEELQLALLGNVEVRRDGVSVTGFRSYKAQALLYYLAVTGCPHTRPALAGLLWGEMPEAKALTNLRQTLTNLRHLVGSHLTISRGEIAFNRDRPYWLDVEDFEALAAGASAEMGVAAWREAVELYRGDFLEDFYVRNALEFEEWALAQQARLRELAVQALQGLALNYTRQGDAGRATAITYTSRLLALEPWREEAHQGLMLLLAQGGQRGAALAQFETCRQVLAQELGVEPGPETRTLYQRIRDGELNGFYPSLVPTQIPSPSTPRLPAFLDSGAEPKEIEGSIFVGRKRELARLDGFLEKALRGRGVVSFVTGEAGQGKTSLLKAFSRQAQAARSELIVASGACNVYTGQGDPFLPFRDILGMLTGDVEALWASGTISRAHALRLWSLLPHAAQALVEHGPNLIDTFVVGGALERRAVACAPDGADWLDRLQELRANREAGSGGGSPDQSRLFAEYSVVLGALAQGQPLLLILDDLHWADLSSISLLSYLARRLAEAPILIVAAYRPEEVAHPSISSGQGGQHPLADVLSEFKRYLGDVWVDLDQVGPAQGREFVDAFLDTQPNRLSEEFRQRLTRTTGGHPLFTIELLRDLEERGDLRQDEAGLWVAELNLVGDVLPVRVEGVIEKRIGRLDPELREALVIASVEGEEFTAEVIAKVQDSDPRDVAWRFGGGLNKQHRLVVAQGIQGLDSQQLSRYQFRHNLFQTYLYNSLDEVKKAHLHQAVGNALEQLYADQTEAVAIQLARHFQQAGIPGQAINYWQQAGQRAVHLSAYEEAIAHFTQALALLETLPDNPERAQQELNLQVALGNALIATKGFGAPEVGETFGRARDLCEHAYLCESAELYPTLWGMWVFYATQGEHHTARELGEQLLRLAQRVEDADLLLEAHHALWTSLYNIGEFSSVRTHCDQALAMYEPQQHFPLAFRYGGHDAGVCGGNFSGPTLWFLGHPDQALQRNQEALALAQDLSHPFSLALAQHWLSVVHQLRREAGPAHDSAEAAVMLAVEQGFPLVVGWASCVWGWALAQLGQVDEGIARIHRGLDVYRDTGAAMDQTHLLALLAEAYGIAGQMEAGLDVVAEGLEAVHQTGERHYEAELYRLKGELLRPQRAQVEADTEAEACFREAVEVARRQKAKSLELRALMSLGRLWHAQGAHGKCEEARHMLSEIYDWFTEGFETPDLKEAKVLLEELA